MNRQLRFQAGVRLKAQASGTPRRLAINAYGGGEMNVGSFGPIVIDLAGLELPTSIPVLADHKNELASIVATGTPKSDGKSLSVSAVLADSQAGNDVLSLLASGVDLQASVGCESIQTRRVESGESATVNGREVVADKRGFTLVQRSQLCEVSIVPIGADRSTSATIAARRLKGSAMFSKSALKLARSQGIAAAMKFSDDDIDKMTETEAKAALKKCMLETDPAEPDADDEKPEKPATAAALIGILANCPRALQLEAANGGWGKTRCRTEALHYMRASRPGASTGGFRGGNSAGSDPAEVIQAALMMRANLENVALKAHGPVACQMARDSGLHRAPFSEIFASHLRGHGIDPGPRRDIEGMIQAAGGSTASLTNLLSNALNKILELQWPQAPGTWRAWCAIRAAKDFKVAKSLRPVFNGDLQILAPSGEIAHGNLADSMIEWQVSTFARMFTISRTSMVNDDLSALNELPTGLILMADRSVSDLAYYGLLSNPGSFFSTGHGNNLTGAGSALSSASLTAAIRQMRLQVGPNGAPLNIPPATLLVSPNLEQTAKEILHSSFQFRDQTSDRQNAGNPLEQSVNLVVEPRLSLGASNPLSPTPSVAAGVPNQWFLFSSPAYLPGIVGFLNGAEAPQVQAADPLGYNFEVPGQSWRCVYDHGFSLGDFRACQRAVGA